MFDIKELSAIQIGLASPETIREKWSHGEVTSQETINYRSQKPVPDGLCCSKIFGPTKDYECWCGRYKKVRYEGRKCENCGVDITTRDVRRERMGHINLASPCTHIWYLKGTPSRIALVLDIPPKELEEVTYYVSHICLKNDKANGVPEEIIKVKDVISEKNGRAVFSKIFEYILAHHDDFGITEGSDEFVRGNELLSRLGKTAEVFNFQACANYFKRYAGIEFGWGGAAIKELLKNVNIKEEIKKINEKLKNTTSDQVRTAYSKRLEVLEAFLNSNNKPEWMVLDVVPVIPPDLRPMLQLDGGRFASSDLNDLYRRLVSRNNRLKVFINANSPTPMIMNEMRMLQESVDALIDNGRRGKAVLGTGSRKLKSLSSGLRGKQGRFRQNLLGKRVDYSGRSVIAVGPSLKMYECGLPREMAIKLFSPYIKHELMKNHNYDKNMAKRLIERYDPVVYEIIEKIIGLHPVLLNRAPTLHRLSIQAFQPKLIDGRAIRLHPLVCTGFNADFDGDQMAVHVPLSKAAQEEALNLMLASNNILTPRDGTPICTPSQDMVLGNYYLTMEETKDEFLKRAEQYRKEGDIDNAEKFELYAMSEGKVFRHINEIILAYQTKQIHLHNRIAIPGFAIHKTGLTEEMMNGYLITSVGRIIFNQIFPSDFPYLNETNDANLKSNIASYFVPRGTNIKEHIANMPLRAPFGKKALGVIIQEIFNRYDRQGITKTCAVMDKIKDQGFKYSTVAGFTISLSDIHTLSNKEELLKKGDDAVKEVNRLYDIGFMTEEERYKKVCAIWKDITKEVETSLINEWKKDRKNPIYMMRDSGARGNDSNLRQLAGMRGLMGNTSGNDIEIPVKNCFREGMSVSEFFIATHGARKGGSDTALKTADAGYLTRKLVDVSQDVIVREIDCGTDRGFKIKDIYDTAQGKVIVKLKDRLIGRFAAKPIIDPNTGEVLAGKNEMITEEMAEAIEKAGIKETYIRNIFSCETKDGVCAYCYGRNLATGRLVEVGQAVGIMAAQSIGEPGTQLTMRTFHTGGVAGSDITKGLPRVKELFEAQDNPKGKAVIAPISGKIVSIEVQGDDRIVTIKNELESQELVASSNAKLRVNKNDIVEAGDKITEGAISPKELLRVSDIEKVERYILKEIHKVYKDQEISISDKHIEIIIRQMLRRVLVVDAGDTDLIAGSNVSLTTFNEKNNEALLNGKRPAVFLPLLLSVIKAALSTDSFLSAASFQQTTSILSDAAVKGKKDYLHGLKENVITGKLIPAGRGLLSEEEEAKILENFSVESKMNEVKECYIEKHERSVKEN